MENLDLCVVKINHVNYYCATSICVKKAIKIQSERDKEKGVRPEQTLIYAVDYELLTIEAQSRLNTLGLVYVLAWNINGGGISDSFFIEQYESLKGRVIEHYTILVNKAPLFVDMWTDIVIAVSEIQRGGGYE